MDQSTEKRQNTKPAFPSHVHCGYSSLYKDWLMISSGVYGDEIGLSIIGPIDQKVSDSFHSNKGLLFIAKIDLLSALPGSNSMSRLYILDSIGVKTHKSVLWGKGWGKVFKYQKIPKC